MVADQLRDRGIRDERVLAAMAAVPRDAFVPKHERGEAYADEPLPIGGGQTISQPYIVARMTELLAVGPGDRVLDVGTGSGYQAAVLAAMGCLVTSIERDPDLAPTRHGPPGEPGYGDRVRSSRRRRQPRGAGRARRGTASSSRPARRRSPIRCASSSRDRRRLVIPVGGRREQQLLVVERRGDEWLEHSDGPCVFVPLVGGGRPPSAAIGH